MIRHTRFRPYIRRAHGGEYSNSFRTAIRLEFYRLLGRPFYVLVQRGFRNHVMAVGPSRREIVDGLLGPRWGGFRAWSKRVQRRASGAKT